MKKFVVFLMVLFIGAAATVSGESFYCGSRVVSTGDTKIEVFSKCGSPDYEEMVAVETTGSVGARVDLSTKYVEKLYYNCGKDRFIRVLTFTDGKLVKIENAGYGSGPQKCR